MDSTTSVHPTVLAFGSLSLDSHTTPSRSSPRLPPETLDQILAELVPRTEPDLVQMTVHSVCLVAKDWLQSGLLALYRRPMLVLAEYSTQGDYGWSQPPPRSFRSAETGDALLRTFEDPESAFLGSLVENLLYLNTWVIDRHCACGEKMEKAYDWARRLLEACPYVRSASFPIRDMLIYDIEKPSPSLPVTFAQLMHLTMVILACDDYDKDSWAFPTFHAWAELMADAGREDQISSLKVTNVGWNINDRDGAACVLDEYASRRARLSFSHSTSS